MGMNKLLLALLNTLSKPARATVEAGVDFIVSMLLLLIAGGLESIHTTIVITVPLLGMAGLFDAAAIGMLVVAGKTLWDGLKRNE